MNLQLVSAVAKYFAVHSVLFFTQLQDSNMQTLSDFSNDIMTSWCVHENCPYNLEEQELLVCEITSECIRLFESTKPPNRSSLVYLFSSTNGSMVEKLENVRLDDNILIVDESSGVIMEHYAIKNQTFQTNFATFNFATNSLKTKNLSKWERRDNLGGTKLLVTILHWYPLSINITEKSDNLTRWDGFMVDILEILEHDLNFTVEYMSPHDGVWGAKETESNETGNYTYWSGMVGNLDQGQADICAGGLSMTFERAQDIDFSIGLLNVPFTLVVGNPNYGSFISEAHLDMSGYLRVFSIQVWISLLLLGLIFGITLTMGNYDRSLTVLVRSLSNYCLALLQLCFRHEAVRISARIPNLLMAIFGMTVFIVYTSDLTAQMTVGGQQKFPRSFLEVIDEEYSILVAKSAAPETHLKQSDLGTPERIVYDKLATPYDYPLDGDLDLMIEHMLRNPKLAHFGTAIDFIGDKRVKELTGFEDALKDGNHFGFQKHSELTQLFSFHLVKLDQSGTLDKIHQKWLGQSKPKGDMSDRIFVEEAKPIGVKNMIFPGFILLTFTILAILVAFYDKCYEIYYKMRRKDK